MKISFCRNTDSSKLQKSIDSIWKKDHVLSKNHSLLNFQHLGKDKYHFVVSENEGEDTYSGLLGYIPTYLYDTALHPYNDIWLALWVTDEKRTSPGTGLMLLKWLEEQINPSSIGIIGINQNVKKIYDLLGYKTGNLNHYYIGNEHIKQFNIAVNLKFNNFVQEPSRSNLKSITFSNIPDEFFNTHPRKSRDYMIRRYERHPIYTYTCIGIFTNNKMVAVFVTRTINLENSKCIRIVDMTGDFNLILSLKESLRKLLQENNAEYIDCYNFGIDPVKFKDWGFQMRDEDTIIPNFFEPFEQKNVDVMFAFKSSYNNYLIFKADGDQDRPNIIY